MNRSALLIIVAVACVSAWSTRVGGQQGPGRGVQPGARGQVQLPDGPGADAVSALCASCHGLNLITDSWGYTKEGWEDRIDTMMTLPAQQMDAITTYLAAHFPVKPVPGAVMISGPVNVRIREWMAPTLGSRPHDPLAARDGSVWWTGQFASKLGRVDPQTAAIKEFPLPAGSGPHGLADDADGNIWYTGIAKHVIGRMDPATGAVTEFPVQKALPAARGPHTPVFDRKGALWFTLQSGHVGRLIPSTGEMKIVPAPSGAGQTYPYGIQVDANGVPWYVDFRGPRIARVDPEAMAVTEIRLAHADARPRRIAITADGAIWWTDFARGFIGRYDPKTGAQREWLSPGGADSAPYGIAAVGDVIWYSESGVRPNTLVRFEPSSGAFQTWAIPSGGGVVRHMMAARDGSLVLACSGVNKIGYVEVGTP